MVMQNHAYYDINCDFHICGYYESNNIVYCLLQMEKVFYMWNQISESTSILHRKEYSGVIHPIINRHCITNKNMVDVTEVEEWNNFSDKQR